MEEGKGNYNRTAAKKYRKKIKEIETDEENKERLLRVKERMKAYRESKKENEKDSKKVKVRIF